MKKLLSAAILCLASTIPALAQRAVTVEPEIQEGGYNNLNTALKAVNQGTENAYVITINSNIDGLTETIIAGSNGDKDITIQGATDDIVVKLAYPNNAESFKMLLNMNNKTTGSLTVKNITFDCDNKETTNDFMAQGAASLTLENVTIKNLIYNGTNTSGFRPGMLRLTGNTQTTTLNNLRFENCTVEGDNAPYNVLNAMSETSPVIVGDFDYILALNNATSSITDGGITTANPTLYVTSGSRTLDKPIVYDSTDFSKFNVNNGSKTQFMLAPADGNLNAIAKNKVLIVNTIDGVKTGAGYPGLVGSSSGVTAETLLDGAEIVVTENINFGSGWSLLAGKTVEIRGANPDVSITRTSDKFFVNANKTGTNVTISNICLDNTLAGFENALISVTTKESSVTLSNVVIKNCNNVGSTASRSDDINPIITCSNNGSWHLNNVTFDNCTVGYGEPLVTTNNAGCSVSGVNNGLSIRVNNAGANSIDAQGLEAGSEPIKLTLHSAIHNNELIQNCNDPELFELQNAGWELWPYGDTLRTMEMKIVTGVEEVTAEIEGDREFFDLRGVRVAADALVPGLYICRQGGKTSKIAIR